MYRYQIKHRIISIFLVFTLIILTNLLVFPSPVSAQDEAWSFPDTPIVFNQWEPYSCPVNPPMPMVDKLILDIADPVLIYFFDVVLASGISVYEYISFEYSIGSWSKEETRMKWDK